MEVALLKEGDAASDFVSPNMAAEQRERHLSR